MSESVVIVAAGRTAIGNFSGSLAGIKASDLGARVISGLLERCGVAPDQVDEVILGQVLTAGCGQNPARQANLGAGLPTGVPAMTINKVRGSGLKAVHLAMQAILCGDADVVIDGLWDAFNHYHMGVTAENVARQFAFERDAQDRFAAESQQKAEAAQKAGRFRDEIIPVEIPQRRGEPVRFDEDEFPRHGTTAEGLAKLRPAFDRKGSVTAGNASGINDGAAAVLVMSERKAAELGLQPLARLKAFAATGVDPSIMGTGPISASTKCLAKAGWSAADLDLIEANEAFAAQAMSVNQEMGLDVGKVNVNGGFAGPARPPTPRRPHRDQDRLVPTCPGGGACWISIYLSNQPLNHISLLPATPATLDPRVVHPSSGSRPS
ncbi:MAG: acetyl-CoA C-acyltransferase [Candidatus Sedimenticola endophacoides]